MTLTPINRPLPNVHPTHLRPNAQHLDAKQKGIDGTRITLAEGLSWSQSGLLMDDVSDLAGAPRRSLSGEQRLFLAVLESAIGYVKSGLPTYADDDLAWINGRRAALTFEQCCEAVSIDTQYLRDGVHAWIQAHPHRRLVSVARRQQLASKARATWGNDATRALRLKRLKESAERRKFRVRG